MKKLFVLIVVLGVCSYFFSSCSKDEKKESLGLLQKELTLTAGQSRQLTYDGECVWSSDEPLIAEVDEYGIVTAKRVGKTLIHAGNDLCDVTVNPKYYTYIEPITEWGITESDIKDLMKGHKVMSSTDGWVMFEGSGIITSYLYIFENDKLSGSIAVSDILLHGEEITNFLLERYVTIDVDKEDYMITMISIDKKTAVGVKFISSSNTVLVIYIPFQENYQSEILSTTKSLTKSIKNTKQEEQINIDDLFVKLSENH